MDSWLSCGTATTLTHTPMPCFSFAEETAGNQGFTLRQGWFCPDAKKIRWQRPFPVATQCLGSTPAYKTGIPMAHGGAGNRSAQGNQSWKPEKRLLMFVQNREK